MFDQFRLKDVLAHYKQNFVSTQWGNEKYKWEAVKWFQDNWDVNAQNFPEMLNRSLDKTFNLLASSNNFPKGMIVGFAKAAPEEVRAMFIALFDESKDVYERMNAFKLQSSILLEKYGNGAAQHYQYENAISTYALAVFVKVIFLFGLRRPCAALVKGAHGKHDVTMGIALAGVVNGIINAHSSGNKLRGTVFPDKPDLFLSG